MELVIKFNRAMFYTENLLKPKYKLLGFAEQGLVGEDIVSGDCKLVDIIEYDKRYHIRDLNFKLNLDVIDHYQDKLKEYNNWKLFYRAKIRSIDNSNIQELSNLIEYVRKMIERGDLIVNDSFINEEDNDIIPIITGLCEDTFISNGKISYINALILSDRANCKVTIREDYSKYYLPIGVIDLFNDKSTFIKFTLNDYTREDYEEVKTISNNESRFNIFIDL